MYIKQTSRKDGIHYILSVSYRDGDCWKHRDLLELGPRPEDFIEYPGGNSFYIKETVGDLLDAKGVKYSPDSLEALFMPFLDPEVRRVVEQFERSGKGRRPWDGYSAQTLLKLQERLHPFDKRRLHYLRCGRVDIGNLEGRPWPFLNILLEKGRDEIEATLTDMERQLPAHEIRPYLYTALQLQNYFRHNLVRHMPTALDPEKVDHYFVEDLCRLNLDETFFRGIDRDNTDSLHAYLVKYLILYFDNEFARAAPYDDYVQDFVSGRRFHRPPPFQAMTISEREACKRLGISPEDWKDMDRHALTRCYRQRAKETHPDSGGDGRTFIRVKEAYECLLVRKT